MTRHRNRVGLVLALGGILSTTGAQSQAQTLHSLPKYLLTEKNVVILTAPQVVAGPTVLDAKWSPDGVHVAAVRRTERFALDNVIEEMRLVLWSAGKQSHEIWQAERSPASVPRIAWISPNTCTVEVKWSERVQGADTDGKIIWKDEIRQSILWADSLHDKVKTIAEMPDDYLYVSPKRPLAALLSPSQHQLILLNEDGNPQKRIPLPDKADWKHFFAEDKWTEDGLHVRMDAEVPKDRKDGTPGLALVTYDLNVQTGELKVGEPAILPAKAAPAGLHLFLSSQEVAYGAQTRRVHPLWLENTQNVKPSAALVAADASVGKICPSGESILYISDHTAFVTALRVGPKEPFIASIKAVVMSNGKQLGLGLVMYALDLDETFPAPSVSLQSALEPYLQNNDLFDGFHYTFAGGPIGNIANPSTTELGIVDGPEGQAVIFADGHVRWKPQ